MDLAICKMKSDWFITDLILSCNEIFRHDAHFNAIGLRFENSNRNGVLSWIGQDLFWFNAMPQTITIYLRYLVFEELEVVNELICWFVFVYMELQMRILGNRRFYNYDRVFGNWFYLWLYWRMRFWFWFTYFEWGLLFFLNFSLEEFGYSSISLRHVLVLWFCWGNLALTLRKCKRYGSSVLHCILLSLWEVHSITNMVYLWLWRRKGLLFYLLIVRLLV
jgi:hypothetical protein